MSDTLRNCLRMEDNFLTTLIVELSHLVLLKKLYLPNYFLIRYLLSPQSEQLYSLCMNDDQSLMLNFKISGLVESFLIHYKLEKGETKTKYTHHNQIIYEYG